MTQQDGAVMTLVSSHNSQDLAQHDDQNDPNKLTKHHRKLKSTGGDFSKRNISHVPLFRHRAWHALYDDLPVSDIFCLFKQDYEVFGTDFVKTDLMNELHQKWANSTKEKIRRREAWYALFTDKTLEQIVEEINTIWLDPDYEIMIGMVRVRTVQLSEVAVRKDRHTRYGYS